MSQLVEIPDDLYNALEAAAKARGTTPIGWIAAHLPAPPTASIADAAREPSPRTLADLFAGRVGNIRSGGAAPLSEECGKQFADHLEAKRRAGHL